MISNDYGMVPCDCGYGDNWYHESKEHLHEYNDGFNPTAKIQADRNPLACFFGHIDGKKVLVKINGKETSFLYSKYSGDHAQKKSSAMKDAAAFISDYVDELKQAALF